MRKNLISVYLCFCILFIASTQAFAQSKKYIVTPFQVNGSADYAYLSEAFPAMLTSRLFQNGLFENVESENIEIVKSNTEAQKVLADNMADYVIYGSITMLGSSASIDMSGLTKDGEKWQKAISTNIDSLIGEIQPISDSIKTEFFAQSADINAVSSTQTTTLAPQTSTSDVRLKSQPLDFSVISMDTGKLSGNDTSDVVLADDLRNVYLYNWNGGAMKPLAQYRVSSALDILAVRTFKMNKQEYIAVTCFNETQTLASTIVLEYNGKELVEYMTMPFFTNTTVLPDSNQEILIGQYNGTNSVYRGEIFEVKINNKKWEKGLALTNLPRRANVYNFTYFPSDIGYSNNVLMLTAQEHLEVFDSKGTGIAVVDELFSGGNAYISVSDGKPAPTSDDTGFEYYYIPLRMIVDDFNNDKKLDIIVNHPITTLGEYLKNYRSYTESEIQAYAWDGIGLDLRWKTPVINGSVSDYQLVDLNNDNRKELLTSVVTSTGFLGFGSGRTILTITELEPVQR